MSIFRFIMTGNFDRPEKEILCDLVYIQNQYKMPPSVVDFGYPKELDQRPDIEEDANTYIDAVVSPNFDYRLTPKETGFLIRRIPLASLRMVDESIIVPPALPFKTYDILDQINAQLGTRLTEDDLVNLTYNTLDATFTIEAKPTSRVWIGKRTIIVEGGGNKGILYENYLLPAIASPQDIQEDIKAQLNQIANSTNAVGWQGGLDFDFGSVQPAVGAGMGRNTRIYVTSRKDGYTDQWLYYRRFAPSSIDDAFAGGSVPKVVVPNDGIFTTYSLLEQINAQLGLNLTADDVVNSAYEPGQTEYPIVFKSTSLGYTAGTYMLKVAYDQVLVPNVRLIGEGFYRASAAGVPRSFEIVQ